MRGRGGRGSRGCRKPTTTVSLFFEAQLPEGLGVEKRECTCKRALGVHTCPWVFLCAAAGGSSWEREGYFHNAM